jgi:hypothetical protein
MQCAPIPLQGLGHYQPGGLFKALPNFRGPGLADCPICGASDDEVETGGAEAV